MKTRSEKWVSGVLGVFCLLLLIHLIMQFSGIKAGASRVPMAARGSGAGRLMHASSSYVPDDLSRYDPEVHLDLLKKYQSRALPRFERNPFAAEAPRPAPPAPVAPQPPPAPPPPPPIPLKAVGYSEKGGGRQEAYVSDEDQVFVVHEGEQFAQKYRVLKITPRSIQIEDETSHQTVELPFAQ